MCATNAHCINLAHHTHSKSNPIYIKNTWKSHKIPILEKCSISASLDPDKSASLPRLLFSVFQHSSGVCLHVFLWSIHAVAGLPIKGIGINIINKINCLYKVIHVYCWFWWKFYNRALAFISYGDKSRLCFVSVWGGASCRVRSVSFFLAVVFKNVAKVVRWTWTRGAGKLRLLLMRVVKWMDVCKEGCVCGKNVDFVQ